MYLYLAPFFLVVVVHHHFLCGRRKGHAQVRRLRHFALGVTDCHRHGLGFVVRIRSYRVLRYRFRARVTVRGRHYNVRLRYALPHRLAQLRGIYTDSRQGLHNGLGICTPGAIVQGSIQGVYRGLGTEVDGYFLLFHDFLQFDAVPLLAFVAGPAREDDALDGEFVGIHGLEQAIAVAADIHTRESGVEVAAGIVDVRLYHRAVPIKVPAQVGVVQIQLVVGVHGGGRIVGQPLALVEQLGQVHRLGDGTIVATTVELHTGGVFVHLCTDPALMLGLGGHLDARPVGGQPGLVPVVDIDLVPAGGIVEVQCHILGLRVGLLLLKGHRDLAGLGDLTLGITDGDHHHGGNIVIVRTDGIVRNDGAGTVVVCSGNDQVTFLDDRIDRLGQFGRRGTDSRQGLHNGLGICTPGAIVQGSIQGVYRGLGTEVDGYFLLFHDFLQFDAVPLLAFVAGPAREDDALDGEFVGIHGLEQAIAVAADIHTRESGVEVAAGIVDVRLYHRAVPIKVPAQVGVVQIQLVVGVHGGGRIVGQPLALVEQLGQVHRLGDGTIVATTVELHTGGVFVHLCTDPALMLGLGGHLDARPVGGQPGLVPVVDIDLVPAGGIVEVQCHILGLRVGLLLLKGHRDLAGLGDLTLGITDGDHHHGGNIVIVRTDGIVRNDGRFARAKHGLDLHVRRHKAFTDLFGQFGRGHFDGLQSFCGRIGVPTVGILAIGVLVSLDLDHKRGGFGDTTLGIGYLHGFGARRRGVQSAQGVFARRQSLGVAVRIDGRHHQTVDIQLGPHRQRLGGIGGMDAIQSSRGSRRDLLIGHDLDQNCGRRGDAAVGIRNRDRLGPLGGGIQLPQRKVGDGAHTISIGSPHRHFGTVQTAAHLDFVARIGGLDRL